MIKHDSGLIKLYPADNVIELLVVQLAAVFKHSCSDGALHSLG